MFPGKFESLSKFYAGVAPFSCAGQFLGQFAGLGNILCITIAITNDLL
jgi:hypothetical protein